MVASAIDGKPAIVLLVPLCEYTVWLLTYVRYDKPVDRGRVEPRSVR